MARKIYLDIIRVCVECLGHVSHPDTIQSSSFTYRDLSLFLQTDVLHAHLLPEESFTESGQASCNSIGDFGIVLHPSVSERPDEL